MKVHVKNFGPIKSAEIDLSKDLILITGQNNTGKTYLGYLIYYLLGNSPMDLLGDYYSTFTELTVIKEIQKRLLSDQSYKLDIVEHLDDFLKAFNSTTLKAYQKNKLKGLNSFFTVSEDSLFGGKTLIKISNSNDSYLKERLHKSKYQMSGSFFSSTKLVNSNIITFEVTEPTSITSMPKEQITSLLQHSIKQTLFAPFLHLIYKEAIILNAERTGISIFSKELMLNKNKLFDALLKSSNGSNQLDLLKQKVNRYPKPIQDSIEIENDLSNLQKQKSEFKFLGEELEKSLLKGKIKITKDGDVKYTPKGHKKALDIHLSSSTVKSLASLVFYLKHLASDGDLIVIDEPELNLHPDNQRIIARFICKLINHGFQVVCSTHSDYILKEINTMIMLNGDSKEHNALLEQLSLDKKQTMDPTKAQVIFLSSQSADAQNIEIEKTGFTIPSIDQTIAEQEKMAEEVYFKLFELKNAEPYEFNNQ